MSYNYICCSPIGPRTSLKVMRAICVKYQVWLPLHGTDTGYVGRKRILLTVEHNVYPLVIHHIEAAVLGLLQKDIYIALLIIIIVILYKNLKLHISHGVLKYILKRALIEGTCMDHGLVYFLVRLYPAYIFPAVI